MPTKAEKEAAKREAAERAAQAKREKAEREAQAKREAAEKKAEAARQAAEKKAEQKRAAAEKAAEAKRAKDEAAKQAAENKAKAAADKAKAATDKKAAAAKAASTPNKEGLTPAQAAQLAKLQKIANQPVQQGIMGPSTQAAIDKANAEIAKIQAQGKTVLDKQYQEEQAPVIEATKQKATAARTAEDEQRAAQQAAQHQQLQQHKMRYLQEMMQRRQPQQNYANPYFQMTQNMPVPVGYEQGPTSQQAPTTMIGAGGDQGGIYGPPQQQMSPGQIAQMQSGIMGGTPQGTPPQLPPQLLAMLQAQQAQQAPQQAPQQAAPQQQMGPNHPMYALGGLLKGYR